MSAPLHRRWQLPLPALLALLLFLPAGWTTAGRAPAHRLESTPRQYAPDRTIDILHLALDLTPDFQKRTITGRVTITFKPIARPCRQIKLDAQELAIDDVTATRPLQGYTLQQDQLAITFAEALPTDAEVRVTVSYHAEPSAGLYFRTPEQGYRPGNSHLFTQGEAVTARRWYPGYDHPNEKFTSEVTCHVPEGMVALSNGRLVDRTRDPATGLVAFRWAQEQPHVNYLVSLVAGHFKAIESRQDNVPLAFWTTPSDAACAARSFEGTGAMLSFFAEETGVPYPWAKYDQVCVADFVAGGMENTSLTTLTDGTLAPPEFGRLRTSESLVAHELAHQWFGDLVTCKDWSQLWLNEGFATYYETLYTGHRHGRDQLNYDLFVRSRDIRFMPHDTNAIVRRVYQDPDALFDYLVYEKGGWVLHMLRAQLGDDLFRRCIHTYLERHRFDTVVTEDLNQVVEELSGRSFDAFFDQWVYHAHYPELDVSYEWDETTRLARISVRQIQRTDASVLLFRFPLTLRFQTGSTLVDRTVEISQREEDFHVPLDGTPEQVRLDPAFTLLAKIRFEPPTPMVQAQLANPDDMIGRLLAIEILGQRRDQDSVARLQHALNHDAFHGVRAEAARALRLIHTDTAMAALLEGIDQADERVRLPVVENLGLFHSDRVAEALLKVARVEPNPDIAAAALRAVGGYDRPDVRDLLLDRLRTPSYRNVLADAAIAGMRRMDQPAFIEPLQEALTRTEPAFTTVGFASGLDALAWLARHESNRTAVRLFLADRTRDLRPQIQQAALRALGTLGDERALPLLETFAEAGPQNPQRAAARQAIETLREDRPPAEEVSQLRQEVTELKDANRDLKQQLDRLRTRFDALPTPVAEPKGASKPKKPVPSR